MKILMVCLGNICRSPMAEAIFKDRAPKTWLIDSAGTSGYHNGDQAHPGTRTILDAMNINSSTLKSRQVMPSDFNNFDLILAMDSQNFEDLKRISRTNQHHKIHMFHPTDDIPDPWYTGNFEQTRDMVIEASEYWLEKL